VDDTVVEWREMEVEDGLVKWKKGMARGWLE